jgi:ATP-dependent HslUV protease subunit HslV
MAQSNTFHATTILAVAYKGAVVFGGDGQVTLQNTIVKHGAHKIRKLQNGEVLSGFAGSAADAFTLFDRFESKLNEFSGQLGRAVVELAKEWRSDKYLRRLEAMMIVADKKLLYLLSGQGDVIQPDDGVLAIGSGGNFALSAARALMRAGRTDLTAREIVQTSMKIAAELCPFTNHNLQLEEIGDKGEK